MTAATALGLLLELGWKSTLVLGVAFAVLPALRTASASARHLLLTAAVLAALALPAVALLGPSVELLTPLPGLAPDRTTLAAAERDAAPQAPAEARGPSAPALQPAAADAHSREARGVPWMGIPWMEALVALYVTVAAALLARFLTTIAQSERRVRSLRHSGGRVQAAVESARVELGITRSVRALASPHDRTPWTWGVLRPAIVLPPEVDGWSKDERDNAIRHELAHIRRCDQLWLAAACVCVAVYWFQPLAWLALRRLRGEAEHACDDRVLLGGASPARYAAQLVQLAQLIRGGERLPLLAMARRSALGQRVRAILNPTTRRTAMNTRGLALTMLGALVLAAAVGPIATVDSQETEPAVLHLYDPVVQRLAANGPANETELATLVAAYVAAERDADAVEAFVYYLTRADAPQCHFCVDLLRRPSVHSLSALAPTWHGLQDAIGLAVDEVERRAYEEGSQPQALVTLAMLHVASGDAAAKGKGTWYLLEALRLGGSSDEIKLNAIGVLLELGLVADATTIARELHEDPASRYYQSATTQQWLDHIESAATRGNLLSARLRAFDGAGSEPLEYLPLHKTTPAYPPTAAAQGLEGHVIIEFTVDTSGRTRDPFVVTSSDAVFEQPALEAARAFLYMPRVVGGAAIDVPGVRNKITFVLEHGG